MPSTYTTNGGIELIATGEQSGTWGDTTNDNLQIIDRLTNGVGTITLSGTTHTLTTSDGALSDGQYAVLVFAGSPSGTNTVTISPNTNQHVYIVRNTTSQSVVLTQGSGGNVTVPAGKSAIVSANGAGAGAAVVDITNTFNFQPLTATLTAIGALAVTDGNIIVGNGSTWVAESGATARTSLGLTIGTNVQAYDAGLQSISGLTTVADRMIYTTASDTYAVTTLTAAGRAILDDADAAAQRTTLGLVIGTNVQAYDADLAAIAGLAVTDGNFIVGNGSTWVAENGNTAIASLGITATAAELNLIDGSSAGTIVNSKAVIYGASGQVNATTLQIGGVSITASAAELNYNDITTLGTSQASKVVTADASGDVILSEELKAKSYNETYASLSGTTPSIDCETGNMFSLSTSGNTTFTFSNPPASGTGYGFVLQVTAGGTHTLTWPASVDWPGGAAPDAPASGETNFYVFVTRDAGTTWYGFLAGAALA